MSVLVFLGIQPFNSQPLFRNYQADIPPAAGWNPAPGFGPYLGVNTMTMGYSIIRRDKTPERKRNYQIIKINPNNPNLSDAINEPSPFPEKLDEVVIKGDLKKYYRELVKKEPIDHVQSKIFEADELSNVRRVLVKEFENKTNLIYGNENAGKVLSRHIYRHLRNNAEFVVSTDKLDAEKDNSQMKLLSDSPLKMDIKYFPKYPTKPISVIPRANPNHFDAIIVGAVTKFRDSFIDEDGNNQKSLASGVEFGSYLIGTKSGKVIWGARYVSSQNPGVFEFFKNGGLWKNKESLSLMATKNVLKTLSNNRSQE